MTDHAPCAAQLFGGIFEWHEVKNNADNHGLDTSVMQLVIASIRGIIKTDTDTETKNET